MIVYNMLAYMEGDPRQYLYKYPNPKRDNKTSEKTVEFDL